MNLDPFGDPFRLSAGFSPADLFRKPRYGGGVRAPKKPEPAPAEEPAPEPLSDGSEDAESSPAKEATPAEKAVLSNPKWEVEDVGFNEETEISIEAKIPESQAHKTKVEFELFGKTPDGPESISKAQGNVADGKAKAKAKIPVYIPQYKDADGNHLPKVDYYFTAKHSASDLFQDDKVVKTVDHMAERHIQSHILQDVTFATGKSFISPVNAPALQSMVGRVKEWKAKYPDAKMAIFGHADAVGQEEPNKKLSERRAESLFALLAKDAGKWKRLYDEEKWGLSSTQELLKHLGHDPGAIDGQDGPKTQAAVKEFQTSEGMAANGNADAAMREALYEAYFASCNTEAIVTKDFDSIDGKPFTGCSEFNLAQSTQGACEANRRVALHLLKSNKNFPIQYPCKQGDVAPCKKQKDRKGARRTAGFGCLFYDQLILEPPNPAEDKPKAPLSNLRWSVETAWCGDEAKLLADSGLADGTEVAIKLKAGDQICEEAKAKVQGGKLEYAWKVHSVGFAYDADKKPKPEVEVVAEVSESGKQNSPEKPLKVRKLVEAKAEEYSDSHDWGEKGGTKYRVKGHFFQGIAGNKAKVTLKKKVMKTWGATYVTVKPAGISDAGGGFPWAGMRWARCPKGSMTPNEYYDKGKWNKIDFNFGGDFGTLPIIRTGEKYHWVHSTANEFPGTFPEYKWEDHQAKRDTWIKDSNKRWTGVHALKRKGCAAPREKPCCSYEVELDFTMDKVDAFGDDVICLAPGPLRSNAGLMFYDDSRIPMCAHEVGHLVGQPDEYVGGAVNPDVNGDGAVDGHDSTTLMGGDLADPNNQIKVRHYRNFAAQLRKLYKNNGGKDEEWIVSPTGTGAK